MALFPQTDDRQTQSVAALSGCTAREGSQKNHSILNARPGYYVDKPLRDLMFFMRAGFCKDRLFAGRTEHTSTSPI